MTAAPPDLGLGRMPAPDERDRRFTLDEVVPRVEPGVAYRYWWADGWWGNQQSTPHCVAFSWTHFMEDGPVTHAPKAASRTVGGPAILDTTQFYGECQRNDEWPGEAYAGTSVRAGAKVLQRRGLVGEYRWGWSLDALVDTVLTTGPVVVGTWWYDDMFWPSDAGRISVGGSRAGGHAYLVNGVNTDRRICRIKNSWGRGWGKKGFAYITFDDMDRLIREQGEVCLALERPTS